MFHLGTRARGLVANGIVGGAAAGLILALAETILAALAGLPATIPLRMIGSVALGPAALSPTFPIFLAIPAFIAVHFALAAAFGIGFLLALSAARLSHLKPALLLAGGLAYGMVIWLVNFLVLAPLAWAQFTIVDQVWQGLLPHTIFFGLPLAVFVLLTRARE